MWYTLPCMYMYTGSLPGQKVRGGRTVSWHVWILRLLREYGGSQGPEAKSLMRGVLEFGCRSDGKSKFASFFTFWTRLFAPKAEMMQLRIVCLSKRILSQSLTDSDARWFEWWIGLRRVFEYSSINRVENYSSNLYPLVTFYFRLQISISDCILSQLINELLEFKVTRGFATSFSVKLHLRDGRTDGWKNVSLRPSVRSFVSLSAVSVTIVHPMGERTAKLHRNLRREMKSGINQ